MQTLKQLSTPIHGIHWMHQWMVCCFCNREAVHVFPRHLKFIECDRCKHWTPVPPSAPM